VTAGDILHHHARLLRRHAASATATAAPAETYIVPMFGVAGGSWSPRITVTNPRDSAVTVKVVHGYPWIAGRCADCNEQPAVTIQPGSSMQLIPFWSDGQQFVIAGAYELETSGPVRIDEIYTALDDRGNELRERIGAARSWLSAGEQLVIAETTGHVRMNALIVNPNPFELPVSVWRAGRAENEVRVSVPAGSTRMVPLPDRICGGAPCADSLEYPPWPESVHFESPAPFLAGVSSIAPSWALFSLAGDDH
jgi:hypothetical protein